MKRKISLISFLILSKLELIKAFIFSHPINSDLTLKREPKVTIVIVTFNALQYIKKCFQSLRNTNYSNFKVVVIDNHSNHSTTTYLNQKKSQGKISVLKLFDQNLYFAKGNNLGVSLCPTDTKFVVLLNSDTEIINPNWLTVLLSNSDEKTIISFGAANLPIRPDGWCFMVPKNMYHDLGGLNEFYQMNWSITELTAKALAKGYRVKTIINPNSIIVHHGKKSYPTAGKIHRDNFNTMSFHQVLKLFWKQRIEVLRVPKSIHS